MKHWHIGILTPDIDKSIEAMSAMPGASRDRWTIGEIEFTESDMITGAGGRLRTAMSRIGGVVYELIEPLDEVSYHAQAIKSRGSGVHHSAYICESGLDETVAALVAAGGRIVWEARHGEEHVYYVELPDGGIWELINVCPFMPE